MRYRSSLSTVEQAVHQQVIQHISSQRRHSLGEGPPASNDAGDKRAADQINRKYGCRYKADAFVQWLNGFVITHDTRKAKVLESHLCTNPTCGTTIYL